MQRNIWFPIVFLPVVLTLSLLFSLASPVAFSGAIELNKNKKRKKKSLGKILILVDKLTFLENILEYIAKHGDKVVLPNYEEKLSTPSYEQLQGLGILFPKNISCYFSWMVHDTFDTSYPLRSHVEFICFNNEDGNISSLFHKNTPYK